MLTSVLRALVKDLKNKNNW